MNSNVIYIVGILAMTTALFANITYESNTKYIREKPVVSHVLDIDMTNEDVVIDHGFSFDLLYGFETTSEIALSRGADAAVNGMFYNDYGMPLGSVIQKGEIVRMENMDTPMVLIGSNNEVVIRDVTIDIRVDVENGYAWLYSVNGPVPDGTWGIFSPIYGKTTRIQRMTTNYLISNGRITSIIVSDSPVQLEGNDLVLSYVGSEQTYEVGDMVDLSYDINFEDFDVDVGFQTGGWLVKDGISVAQNYEPFVGYTTASQPRTLVGIRDDGHLLLVVVDGRQQGYSVGVSGIEAAKLMLEYGCVNAAYLDGGASSTMFYDGKVVNQPSNTSERAVAHTLLIFDQ